MNAKEISDSTLESVTPANNDLMLIYDTSEGTTGKATIADIAQAIARFVDMSDLPTSTPEESDFLIFGNSETGNAKNSIASIAPIIQANFDISNEVASGDTRPVESDAVYTALKNALSISRVSDLPTSTPEESDFLIFGNSETGNAKNSIASIAPIIQANFDISNEVASGDTRPVESDAVYTALKNVDAVKYVSTLPIGTDIKNLIYGIPKTSGNFEFYVGNAETQLTYALSGGKANFEDITSQIEMNIYIKPYATLKVLKMGKFVIGNLYVEEGAPKYIYIPEKGMTFLTGLPKPIGAFFKVDSEMMYDRNDDLLFDDLQLFVTANNDTGILKAIKGQTFYHKLSVSFSYILQ